VIRFINGPAAGVDIDLRRAPIMLRVVRSRYGNWDALDQPHDEAQSTESIYVYRMIGQANWYHCRSSKRSISGFHATATYEFLPEQPPDHCIRTTKAWAEWCDSNKEQLLEGRKQ
jgi:hypothetical protein